MRRYYQAVDGEGAYGLTIDQLIFKGTHNSYARGRGRTLGMNHAPDKQIDDFGVWCLELDFGVEREHGGPVAVVGHDRPGERACWGYYLADYLRLILSTRSLQFRPVFVYLEVKAWKRAWRRPWRMVADAGFGFQAKLDIGLESLRATCGDRFVILEEWLTENRRWPRPEELAGKVVLYEPNKRTPDGTLQGLKGTHAAHCVSAAEVEAAIERGVGLEKHGAVCEGGARALRLDQYQAGWTFAYGVAPNPIVVDPDAPARTRVDDAEGRRWRCGGETSHGEEVGEQGTYRFPYRTTEQAIERARGVTAATHGLPDLRRAGVGWTVLLRGRAREMVGYDAGFPLTFLAEA